VRHRHKLLISLFKAVEKPVFGSLVWGLPLMEIEFSSLLGMLMVHGHNFTSLTIFSNGRGGGDNGGGVAASGKKPISTLEQAVANFAVDPSSGTLTQSDYFEPFEYDSLNGGDRDFGSSGVALLDSKVFSGGGVNRLAVAGGKSGKVYVMNADDLGGFGGNLIKPRS
jgi:hypothetical protein